MRVPRDSKWCLPDSRKDIEVILRGESLGERIWDLRSASYYVPFPATITGRLKRTASIVVAPLTCTAAVSRSSAGTGKRHETRSA